MAYDTNYAGDGWTAPGLPAETTTLAAAAPAVGKTLKCSEGNDHTFGGQGNDRADGRAGDDYVNGLAGNDTIYGGGGSDTLLGSNGDDLIYGGEGTKDALFGGSGNDTLVGGAGKDLYYGQEGADVFVFTSLADSVPGGGPHTSYGHDIIKPGEPHSGKGFDGAGQAGGDLIDLKGLGDLTWGKSLKVQDHKGDGSGHTYVVVDKNMDGKLDFEVAIYDGDNFTASDYTANDFLFL